MKACTAVKILYLASPAWQKLLLSSFTGGIQACLGFFDEKVRSTVAHHRESRQSIYQYFKSRSLHATQINFHKIRFPESRSQIPIPVQFFCQPDLMKSTILFWFERWLKNCFIQNSVDDEYTESMSIWNTDFLSHWSLSLSYLYWKIQKPTPRRKIEFLTDCCFNFQFNLRSNEYINSNAPNAPLFNWWRKSERMKEMSELKSDLFELAFVIYLWIMTCLRAEKNVSMGEWQNRKQQNLRIIVRSFEGTCWEKP